MGTSIGIGNLNTEPVELNSSALNLHNRIQVDPSLITGNDVYVAPTGGRGGPCLKMGGCDIWGVHYI